MRLILVDLLRMVDECLAVFALPILQSCIWTHLGLLSGVLLKSVQEKAQDEEQSALLLAIKRE